MPLRGRARGDQLKVTLVEFSPSGGLYQFAFDLGQALAELGHQVELVTGPDPELLPVHGVMSVLPILPTWHPGVGRQPALVRKFRRVGRGLRYLVAWRRLEQHLARSRPDVVQWAEWRFTVDGLLVARLARQARRAGAPVMVDLAHSPIPLEEQRSRGSLYKSGPLLFKALHAAYRSMDAVLVLGDHSRRQLRETWPGLGRVEVISHGVQRVFVHGATMAPDPPSTCARQVLFFGTLARYKGLDTLLDAFAIVRNTVPDAQLVIAGPVVDIDYQALATRAGAMDGVHLHPGYVPVADVAPLVGRARVVAAPYLRSNSSGVVRLAQTLGRPVVVSAVGDLANSVSPGETGHVVKPGDSEALAAALRHLLCDPSAADRMGELARVQLTAESAVAAQVAEIYEDLLARRRTIDTSGQWASAGVGTRGQA